MTVERREELEAKLGDSFRDGELLERALTHKSHAHEQNGDSTGAPRDPSGDNEQLEFLGDAFLDMLVVEYLYDQGGKYINTPATLLFDKSRTLYLIDRAKAGIRRTGRAVLVEGNTDALMAHQAGFDNVVGTLGTALTAGHEVDVLAIDF